MRTTSYITLACVKSQVGTKTLCMTDLLFITVPSVVCSIQDASVSWRRRDDRSKTTLNAIASHTAITQLDLINKIHCFYVACNLCDSNFLHLVYNVAKCLVVLKYILQMRFAIPKHTI